MKPLDAPALANRLQQWQRSTISFLLKHENRLLWLGIILFVVVFSAIGAWKLWAGGYNGYDLAIYRQVAANSVRGDFFGLTINPHSYLGDHFEILFAVLWPFYSIVKHPLILLFIQNVALAWAAVPIATIAGRLLGKPWPVLFALAYLANPMVQNMALFEFHMLPFAIPVMAFMILAYLDRRFGRFMLWALLAMTVREDVALVIIGFGFLALLDRRHWRWSVAPMVVGLLWFLFATTATTFFSGYAGYKFLYYYSWLGDSPGEMLKTITTKPWVILQHLFTTTRIGLLLALLMPFAFFPLLRRRWLIPVVPVLAQIFFAGWAGGVVIETHYPALLLPFMLVSVMAVFASLRHPSNSRLVRLMSKELAVTLVLYCTVVLYSMVALGPLVRSLPILAATPQMVERIRLQQTVLRSLPAGGTVAGPEDLTGISDRPRLYSLYYVFVGHKQFSEDAYVLPDDATVVVLNQQDVLTFQSVSGDLPTDAAGYGRIRSVLMNRGFVQTAMIDRYGIFERRAGAITDFSALFSTIPPVSLVGGGTSHGSLVFNGWTTPDQKLVGTTQEFHDQQFRVLPFDLVLTKTTVTDTVHQVEFTFNQQGRTVYQVLLPLGGGLFPTSDWTLNEPVTTHYRLLLPATLHGSVDLNVRIIDLEADIGLNGVRSAVPFYSKYQPVGPTIKLGPVDL